MSEGQVELQAAIRTIVSQFVGMRAAQPRVDLEGELAYELLQARHFRTQSGDYLDNMLFAHIGTEQGFVFLGYGLARMAVRWKSKSEGPSISLFLQHPLGADLDVPPHHLERVYSYLRGVCLEAGMAPALFDGLVAKPR